MRSKFIYEAIFFKYSKTPKVLAAHSWLKKLKKKKKKTDLNREEAFSNTYLPFSFTAEN